MAPCALVPGGGSNNVPWNFTEGDGFKLHQAATKPFDPKCDGNPETLQHFLDAIQFRASACGLDIVLNVETGTSSRSDMRSLTSECGSIAHDNMIDHALTHQDQDDRKRQASQALITLLTQSLEPEVMDELKQKKTEHLCKVRINNVDTLREDGPSMLHSLICTVAVDTKSTISSILRMLTGPVMCDTMQEVDSNVQRFNKKINVHLVALRARRAEVPNIVPALFEACQSCDDTTFVDYMGRKEEQHEDNAITSFTNVDLMKIAHEKHKTLNDKKQWKKKTKKELDFIALKAKLAATRKRLTQNPAKPKESDRKAGPKNDGEWAWKSIAPRTGEARMKANKGKECIHCPHHGDTQWVLKVNRAGVEHATGCRAMKATQEQKAIALTAAASVDASSSAGSPGVTPAKKGKFVQAMTNLWEEEMSGMTLDDDGMPK